LKLWISIAFAIAAPGAVRRDAWPNDIVVDTAVKRIERALRMTQATSVSVELKRDSNIGAEAYRIRFMGSGPEVASGGSRGILYGSYALAEEMETKGGVRPIDRISVPRFPIREWWSAAFQANFNLPLGGAFDRSIEEISEALSRTIEEAPRYGINTLQLMGRAGEGGIDLTWFLQYDAFPKLHRRTIGWGAERRIEEIRKLALQAHAHGLYFLVWDHELVFPDRMLEAYPEMRGIDYPFCFSHPLVMRFLNAKIDEFFRRIPEADGLDLTFAETHGYNILEHGGCRCRQCRRLGTHEKIRRIILAVHDACRRNGKRLEVRSYNQKPEDAQVMLKALAGLPHDIPIITKNTVVDFRGSGYPDNPMLGAFSGQPEVLELTATPEGSGYGYIPALLGDFYAREISKIGTGRHLAGIAVRTDYHLQYGHATFFTDGPPVLTFDTPNDFNIFVTGRLVWNPHQKMDDLWREWTTGRYGAQAAPAIERALRRTAAISQGIFFVKGFSLLTHLDMVPHLDSIDTELDKSYLLAFFPTNPVYRRTYEALRFPTAQTLSKILEEKAVAAKLADESISDVRQVERLIRPDEFQRLIDGLETSRNAALLWKQIAAVYFLLRTAPPNDSRLAASVQSLVAESCRIEKEAGKRWPVYPAARGTTAYQFAQEAIERGKLCCIPAPACR
jgi:hypothetical protein